MLGGQPIPRRPIRQARLFTSVLLVGGLLFVGVMFAYRLSWSLDNIVAGGFEALLAVTVTAIALVHWAAWVLDVEVENT